MSGDEEEPTFTRRHKALIRRHGSFRRMQDLPQRVDDWFHNDEALHRSWDAFAQAHRGASPVFSPTAAAQGLMIESDHKAREVHEAFCEAFEVALGAFLDEQKVTMDQFQEAFKISKDEEARDGTSFYRWPEVVEFEVFLTLMRGNAEALLKRIDELSDQAKQDYRRRVAFFPLLVKAAPATFSDLDGRVSRALRDSGATLNLSRVQLKELTRWKVKLAEKKLNAEGVYETAPPDESEWARYLAFATSQMTAKAFDSFMSHFTTPEHQTVRSDRQAMLECFAALDALHHGSIDLDETTALVAKSGVVNERVVKKAAVKWRHLLSQQQKSDAEVAAIAPELPAEDEATAPGRLSLLRALDFFQDLLKPQDGCSVLFQARLDKVAEMARDL